MISRVQKIPGGVDGAGVLGLHLEGPFISPNKKGAHPEEFIKEFDEVRVRNLYSHFIALNFLFFAID